MDGSTRERETLQAERRTYTVLEVSEILGIGKSKAYELCNSGLFRTLRIGRCLRIPKASFKAWLDGGS